MKKASAIVPLAATLVAALAFYLRTIELTTVFEPLTGLNERGAPLTVGLITLTVAFIIFALVFSRRVGAKHKSPEGFFGAFSTNSYVYLFSLSTIALVWGGATAIYAISHNAAGTFQTVELYYTVLSAISALCLLVFAIEVFRAPNRKSTMFLILPAIIFATFWLVLIYRDNASNPILLSYSYYALAVIFTALSFYYLAGFVFSKPSPGRTTFVSLCAVFFCFITLADTHSFGIKLIFSTIIILNLLHMVMLLKNLQTKPPKEKNKT